MFIFEKKIRRLIVAIQHLQEKRFRALQESFKGSLEIQPKEPDFLNCIAILTECFHQMPFFRSIFGLDPNDKETTLSIPFGSTERILISLTGFISIQGDLLEHGDIQGIIKQYNQYLSERYSNIMRHAADSLKAFKEIHLDQTQHADDLWNLIRLSKPKIIEFFLGKELYFLSKKELHIPETWQNQNSEIQLKDGFIDLRNQCQDSVKTNIKLQPEALQYVNQFIKSMELAIVQAEQNDVILYAWEQYLNQLQRDIKNQNNRLPASIERMKDAINQYQINLLEIQSLYEKQGVKFNTTIPHTKKEFFTLLGDIERKKLTPQEIIKHLEHLDLSQIAKNKQLIQDLLQAINEKSFLDYLESLDHESIDWFDDKKKLLDQLNAYLNFEYKMLEQFKHIHKIGFSDFDAELSKILLQYGNDKKNPSISRLRAIIGYLKSLESFKGQIENKQELALIKNETYQSELLLRNVFVYEYSLEQKTNALKTMIDCEIARNPFASSFFNLEERMETLQGKFPNASTLNLLRHIFIELVENRGWHLAQALNEAQEKKDVQYEINEMKKQIIDQISLKKKQSDQGIESEYLQKEEEKSLDNEEFFQQQEFQNESDGMKKQVIGNIQTTEESEESDQDMQLKNLKKEESGRSLDIGKSVQNTGFFHQQELQNESDGMKKQVIGNIQNTKDSKQSNQGVHLKNPKISMTSQNGPLNSGSIHKKGPKKVKKGDILSNLLQKNFSGLFSSKEKNQEPPRTSADQGKNCQSVLVNNKKSVFDSLKGFFYSKEDQKPSNFLERKNSPIQMHDQCIKNKDGAKEAIRNFEMTGLDV